MAAKFRTTGNAVCSCCLLVDVSIEANSEDPELTAPDLHLHGFWKQVQNILKLGCILIDGIAEPCQDSNVTVAAYTETQFLINSSKIMCESKSDTIWCHDIHHAMTTSWHSSFYDLKYVMTRYYESMNTMGSVQS